MMKSLNLHIYRPCLLQALNEDDFDRRVEFTEWIQIMSEADTHFLRSILWTDEATFKTNGLVIIAFTTILKTKMSSLIKN